MALGTYIHERVAAARLDHSPVMTDAALYGCWLWMLSFFFPPLAVFLERGCGWELLLNFLLSCIAWLPGVVHAFYVTCRYESPIYYDPALYGQAALERAREGGAISLFTSGETDEQDFVCDEDRFDHEKQQPRSSRSNDVYHPGSR